MLLGRNVGAVIVFPPVMLPVLSDCIHPPRAALRA
jgi:hypothetical protein